MASYVKVRLSSGVPGIAEALRVLRIAALADRSEISGMHPNRCEPGYRVYAALRFSSQDETTEDQRGAAHSRQAIRRPAAPLTAKETQGKRQFP